MTICSVIRNVTIDSVIMRIDILITMLNDLRLETLKNTQILNHLSVFDITYFRNRALFLNTLYFLINNNSTYIKKGG